MALFFQPRPMFVCLAVLAVFGSACLAAPPAGDVTGTAAGLCKTIQVTVKGVPLPLPILRVAEDLIDAVICILKAVLKALDIVADVEAVASKAQSGVQPTQGTTAETALPAGITKDQFKILKQIFDILAKALGACGGSPATKEGADNNNKAGDVTSKLTSSIPTSIPISVLTQIVEATGLNAKKAQNLLESLLGCLVKPLGLSEVCKIAATIPDLLKGVVGVATGNGKLPVQLPGGQPSGQAPALGAVSGAADTVSRTLGGDKQ